MQFLAEANAGNQAPADSTPSTPAADTPVDAATAAPAADGQASPKVIALAEDALVEFEDAGQKRQITLKEFREGQMRLQDYTRKTQETAALRKQTEAAQQAWQQQQAQREQQLLAELSKPEVILQLAERATGKPISQLLKQLEQPAADPNGIVTIGEAQKLVQTQAQQLQAQMQRQIEAARVQAAQEMQQATQELLTQRDAADFSIKLQDHLQGIFKEHKILSAVDGMEDLLRYKVYQRQPATLEEAYAAFNEEAGKQVEKLNAQWTELNKQQLAQQQKLKQGIEPPGGTAPQPVPQKFSLGDKGLTQSIEAYLRQQIAAQK